MSGKGREGAGGAGEGAGGAGEGAGGAGGATETETDRDSMASLWVGRGGGNGKMGNIGRNGVRAEGGKLETGEAWLDQASGDSW